MPDADPRTCGLCGKIGVETILASCVDRGIPEPVRMCRECFHAIANDRRFFTPGSSPRASHKTALMKSNNKRNT